MPTGPGSEKYWREATSIAKKQGYKRFTEGSPGRMFVKHMAETLAAKDKHPSKK